MKAKDAKQYLTECIETINRIKGTDLKLIHQEFQKTRPNAKFCDSVIFTLVFDKRNFFKLYTNLWVNVNENTKAEYQKCLIENIWERVREINRNKKLEQNKKKIVNNLGISPISLGLGEYTRRPEPVYIDPNSAYVKTNMEVDYSKADIDMTLEGFRHQQVLKQHRDELLAALELEEHPRLQDKDDWDNTY